MRVLKKEILKLLVDKSLWILTLLLVLLNFGLAYIVYSGSEQGKISYSSSEYKKVYFVLGTMTAEKAHDKIVGDIEARDNNKGGEAWNRLMSDVNIEYSHVVYYSDILSGYIDDVERKINGKAGILLSKYAYRDLMHMLSDLNSLKDIRVKSGPTKGIINYFNYSISDLLCIIFALLLIIRIVFNERVRGDISLYLCTINGHERLSFCKYIIVLVLTSCFVIVIQISNIFLAYNMYGFGNVERSIQSIWKYGICPFKMSIIEFIVLNILIKILVNCVTTAFLFLVFSIMKSMALVYFGTIAVVGVPIVLFYSIDENSNLSILKNMNLFAFMNGGRLLGEYRNINLLGIPFNYCISSVIVMMCILVAISLAVPGIYNKGVYAFQPRSSLRKLFVIRIRSLFNHEFIKCLYDEKVAVFIVIAFLFGLAEYKPISKVLYIPNTYYEDVYIDMLKGDVTEDKIKYIDDTIYEIEQRMEKGEYSESMENSYEALVSIRAIKTEYLKKKGGEYLIDTGYRILAGDKKLIRNNDSKMGLIMVLFVIYPLAVLFGYDKQNGMKCMIRTTMYGRRKLTFIQLIHGWLILTFVYLCVYGPIYLSVYEAYGFASFSATACSMEHLECIPRSVGIGLYLICVAIARYIGVLLIMVIAKVLSHRLSTVMEIAVILLVVVALPLILVYLEIPGTQYLLLNPLIIGNIFGV